MYVKMNSSNKYINEQEVENEILEEILHELLIMYYYDSNGDICLVNKNDFDLVKKHIMSQI